MALLWLEGWEASCLQANMPRYYTDTNFTASFADVATAASAPSGTHASCSGKSDFRTPVLMGATQGTAITGFAFRSSNDIAIQRFGEDPAGVQFLNVDGEQCRIEFYDANPSPQPPGAVFYKIRLMRGATELCATDQSFLVSDDDATWIYFEFKVVISDAGGSIVGRYRFAKKPSQNPSGGWTTLTWDAANTSIDTKAQTSTGFDRVGMSMVNSKLDDWYVADGSGSKNNDYLGKLVIVGQKPSGDGTTVEFSLTGGASSTQNAWDETIDSVTSGSDDDRRLSSDTTNQVHLATVDAISGLASTATVIGTRQDLVGRMETAGDLDIYHRYRKTTATAGETDGGFVNLNTTGWIADSEVLEDDPNTATDWALGDLDSYEHGARNGG